MEKFDCTMIIIAMIKSKGGGKFGKKIRNVASEINLLVVVAEEHGTIVEHDAYRRLRVG